jgi:hypothetical protein
MRFSLKRVLGLFCRRKTGLVKRWGTRRGHVVLRLGVPEPTGKDSMR